MRIIKFSTTIWLDTEWGKFIRASWKKKAYWFTYQKINKNAFSFTIGAFKFDIKIEGKLDGE